MSSLINLLLKYKKITLSAILLLGLTLTYIYEEKWQVHQDFLQISQTEIFHQLNIDNLEQVQAIKFNILVRNSVFYTKSDREIKASRSKVLELVDVLKKLKVDRVMSNDKASFNWHADLKMTIAFAGRKLEIQLGDKQVFSRKFYMLVKEGGKESVYLISDLSADPMAYQTDEEYQKSDYHYKRLQMIFYLTNIFFYETKVFSDEGYVEDKINFNLVEVATFRNTKFSLNFETSQTSPAPFKGIEYFDDNWLALHRTLSFLQGKNLITPYNESLLSEPLSIMTIVDRRKKFFELQLFKSYGSLKGYFLKVRTEVQGVSHLWEHLYELSPEVAQHFFVNVQDFWDKRIIKNSSEISISFSSLNKNSKNQQTDQFKISNKDLFNVYAISTHLQNHKLNINQFKKLFDLLNSQADHVEEYKLPIDGQRLMIIGINDNTYQFYKVYNTLSILDEKNKIVWSYYLGSELPFGVMNKDYYGPQQQK